MPEAAGEEPRPTTLPRSEDFSIFFWIFRIGYYILSPDSHRSAGIVDPPFLIEERYRSSSVSCSCAELPPW